MHRQRLRLLTCPLVAAVTVVVLVLGDHRYVVFPIVLFDLYWAVAAGFEAATTLSVDASGVITYRQPRLRPVQLAAGRVRSVRFHRVLGEGGGERARPRFWLFTITDDQGRRIRFSSLGWSRRRRLFADLDLALACSSASVDAEARRRIDALARRRGPAA